MAKGHWMKMDFKYNVCADYKLYIPGHPNDHFRIKRFQREGKSKPTWQLTHNDREIYTGDYLSTAKAQGIRRAARLFPEVAWRVGSNDGQ